MSLKPHKSSSGVSGHGGDVPAELVQLLMKYQRRILHMFTPLCPLAVTLKISCKRHVLQYARSSISLSRVRTFIRGLAKSPFGKFEQLGRSSLLKGAFQSGSHGGHFGNPCRIRG